MMAPGGQKCFNFRLIFDFKIESQSDSFDLG